jgi:hypothetical protein
MDSFNPESVLADARAGRAETASRVTATRWYFPALGALLAACLSASAARLLWFSLTADALFVAIVILLDYVLRWRTGIRAGSRFVSAPILAACSGVVMVALFIAALASSDHYDSGWPFVIAGVLDGVILTGSGLWADKTLAHFSGLEK